MVGREGEWENKKNKGDGAGGAWGGEWMAINEGNGNKGGRVRVGD
jgi:hypothetical protein